MQQLDVHTDLTVVGGGLAGVCAAIGAARQGCTVALVQNRPVLGGNSSSEIRVWVCGATAHGVQHFARETGIMGELFVENQYRNPEGNPYYWDLVVLEAVKAEPNIRLFLNTDVRTVAADDGEIRSVTGWQMGSEKEITFHSPAYADCSGDGLIGFLAGAEFMTGREPRSAYGESWAPEVPDGNTLGSTILFYTKDAGEPVRFVPPSFAKDISTTSIPERRIIRTDAYGCAYWWIEWGGELDVVDDNERIRDELQAAVYGIWDHIKNSGRFDADRLTLEWIGAVPGKREYRRFVGDHVLTQHDVLGQTEFDDRVAFGGWSIDLHPPGGMYATERGSKHWHPDGNYHIPLRTLYSRNVRNLWMAGRNISATHVAFGTTRVMATCAVLGEAAGTAAAVALSNGLTPRELATERFDLVRHALQRADASVLGVVDSDPANLALTASATASSTLRRLAVEVSDGTLSLASDVAMVLPVDPALDGLELLVDATEATSLAVELHDPLKPQNYLPLARLAGCDVELPAGEKRWVSVPLSWRPEQPGNVLVVLKANPAVSVHTSATALPGTICFAHREPDPDERYTEQFRSWKHILPRGGLCYRVGGDTSAYSPSQVVGGYSRPYGGPNLWCSEDLAWDPAPRLEVRWPEPVEVGEVVVILDDDVEEDLINLHHHRTPYEVLPTLLRDYQLEGRTADGEWQHVATVEANRRRRQVHRLARPALLSALRLTVTATNGARRAHVVSLRAY
ncbi:pyridine nucleotide-disulfide oxidoreductase [Kribbella sp. ALI-6-A]|uniref:FAD-dependent oxidoreductase n=1 Tax=Kribbella sp. ALI-6-A TaxID=1933817 RepID=UPI00097C423D|nr:FAD-dependent oxidoreductase [Kribbella sp. ALI-6-A]ONI68656.1 pyridine nucleotide-disulfide oxidoreductase [Kribbella sp. ALI-6-A]